MSWDVFGVVFFDSPTQWLRAGVYSMGRSKQRLKWGGYETHVLERQRY